MIPHVADSKTGAIDEVDSLDYVEKSTKVKWLDWMLLNRPLKVIFALSLATIVAPLLIYQFMFFASYDLPPSDGYSFGSCFVSREARLPCGIEAVDPENCHSQCCYDYDSNMCFHRFPSRFSYITEDAWTENTVLNARIPTVPYKSQDSLSNIKLSIDEISATHLSLSFYQSEKAMSGQRLDEKFYSYNITHPELSIAVNSTQGNIFNTFHGPIIASENIWEMTFKITEESMYGLGEIPLKEGTTKILYNHDGGLTTIPLIFGKSNVSYHGLLIDTVNPTEVIVRSDNQLVIRSITNKGIKLHLFVGPKPADVMMDVIDVIGIHKELDYWSLGIHVCSENTSEDTLTDINTFITTARTQGIPFESHCGLAPVVFDTKCDSSQVTLVNQGATTIKNAGKKFVPHVSPYIRYTETVQKDSEEAIEEEDQDIDVESRTTDRCFNEDLYKNYLLHDSESNEAIYIGEVNNQTVIYPNYNSANEDFIQHLWLYSTDFDGLVLENNWPVDDTYKYNDEIYNAFPYFNEYFEESFNHTLKWNATRITKENASETEEIQYEKYFYTHNEYGNEQVHAFEKIKGPVPILSTSIWMNGNVTLNRQKIPTSWSSLHNELIEASLGGVSGLWYWSSPICGDTENFDNATQIRLCAKWYMAATYMPMVKIHSKEVRRDPLAFIGTDKIHITTALNRRMSLMPYFYTVLQEGPLLRPMFYQFPETDELKDISTQFAVGNSLLIVPNLLPSQTHVHIVMPPGIWFEMWSGLKIEGEEGDAVTMSTTEADFLTLIRGGSIMVIQKDVRLTTDETRLHSPYSLIIALDCKTEDNETNSTENIETTTEPISADNEPNPTCEAKGKFHMTANVSMNFDATYDTLIITATEEDLAVLCSSEPLWAHMIEELSIYGLNEDKNNYDHHRSVTTYINLCILRNDDEIVVRFLD